VLLGREWLSGQLVLPRLTLPAALILLFSEFAAASLFWSSLDPLNIDKLLRFLVLTAPSFFIALLLGRERPRLERLIRMFLLVSAAIFAYYAYCRLMLGIDLASFNADPVTGQPPADVNNYLEYGEHAEILFILFLLVVVFGSARQALFAIAGAAFSIWGLVTIGGRGPFALAILALPLLAAGLLLREGGPGHRLVRVVGLVAALCAIALAGYVALSDHGGADLDQFRTLERYQMQLSQQDTSSMNERSRGREKAFREWLEKPLLGWGIGEFRVQESYLKYPHNLLLEVLMETGLVGAVLLFVPAALAVQATIGIARNRASGWAEFAVAIFFLTQLVSHLTVQGYLADDRFFLALIGLTLAAPGGRALLAKSRGVR
jgi:O-antigen ligase